VEGPRGQREFEKPKADGFVKVSCPLGAGLPFTFVAAAHLLSALHSSAFGRLVSGAFYETIVPLTFTRWSKAKRKKMTAGPFTKETVGEFLRRERELRGVTLGNIQKHPDQPPLS